MEISMKPDQREKINNTDSSSENSLSKNSENNLFKQLKDQSNWDFDYEVGSIKFLDDGLKQVYLSENSEKVINKSLEPIDYNAYWDSTEVAVDDNKGSKKKKVKANILKRLVSKKKRRLRNEYFDLDLAYITKRIIAMGFPSTGCETLWRNSLADVQNYLRMYHKEVKVYNLCLEKKRIYNKDRFPDYKVGLFPFTDHEPCPIKLMLDFCVDICLYFIRHPYAVAAVHCKAGKGRTGIMCICYLIFSGLCKNSDEAIAYYAKMRTINNKGVTIPSQIRYIKYFETFLTSNLTKPYYKMIPKIMKYYINPNTENLIKNYIHDDSYFSSKNKFILNFLKIGPFPKNRMLKTKFSSLIHKNLLFPQAEIRIINEAPNKFFYLIKFNSDFQINFDISLDVRAFKIKFYMWINLWYSTLENISHYIYEHKLFIKENKVKDFVEDRSKILLHAPTFVDIKTKFLDYQPFEDIEEIKFDNKHFGILEKKPSRHMSLDLEENKARIMRDGIELEEVNNKNVKTKVFSESCDTLIKLIEQLSLDNDVNNLIDGINKISASRSNVPLFKKDDIDIFLKAGDLDKFVNAKDMDKDFKVHLNYKVVS